MGLGDWTCVYVPVGDMALNEMTYDWLADKNSPYPFTEAEMKRWHVQEKVERLKVGIRKFNSFRLTAPYLLAYYFFFRFPLIIGLEF